MDVMMHEIKQLKREDDNERVVRLRQAHVQGQSIWKQLLEASA